MRIMGIFSDMLFIAILFAVVFTQIIGQTTTREPIVLIPYVGGLRGSIATTRWTNQSFYQFLGVPYAESPSGSRRFKPPVPVRSWYGIRDARRMGQSCVQGGMITKPMHPTRDVEDCLNMNIYTPANRMNVQYPVMFFVHGGFFSTGSNAEYPASYLLERDIILVVPNYRLDALGFLSTKSPDIPGNAGVMDILLALIWVKNNIKYFGGNPNQITVAGQSSGGAMVTSLLLSPLVPSNLFQQMIIHSGTVIAPWAYALQPVAYAKDIAWRANVPKNATLRQINDAFMKMDVYDLIKATNEHYEENRIKGSNRVGGRSLTIGGPSNYLPYAPSELLQMGYYKKHVNVIAGVVKNEGSFLTAHLYEKLKSMNLLNNGWFINNLFVPVAVNLLGVQDRWEDVFSFAQSIFSEESGSRFADYADGFSELAGDVAMKEPILELAQTNLKSGRTFLYSFEYVGAYTRFGFGADTSDYPFEGGVAHQDELIYLFPYPPNVANLNANDTQIAQHMVDLWTSFVRDGQPKLTSNTSFVWRPLSSETGPFLHIDKEFVLDDDFIDEFFST